MSTKRFGDYFITLLFIFEAIYFLQIIYITHAFFKLITPEGSLSSEFWVIFSINSIKVVALLAVAVGYWVDFWLVRKILYRIGLVIAIYGVWSFFQVSSYVMDWKGVFHGEVVALGALHWLLIVAIGVCGFLNYRLILSRR